MDTIEFSKNIPAEQLAGIFRNYFEQHMMAYYVLKGVNFVSINNISMDEASIMYSVKILETEQKEQLLQTLQRDSANLNIYGKQYHPEIYMNGDLLCITIKKDN